MKKFLLIPLVGLIISCGSNQTSTEQQKTDSTSTIVTKTDTIAKESTTVSADAGTSQKLLGMWAPSIDENVAFEIKDKVVFYPEHNASYKYTLVGDS